jgi:transcriptional regulator with XRE-family HTH domain
MLSRMDQPDSQPPRTLTRPAIGVLVDPERMAAARKSAMLERIELAALSQALDLMKIAAENGLDTGSQADVKVLRKTLADAGIDLTRAPYNRRRIGVSRDEIAKLESRKGKRPKITTLRKLIDALNYARAQRDKPPLDIEDLQVPGEVLIPPHRDDPDEVDYPDEVAEWERQILDKQAADMAAEDQQSAIDAYQEVSNEIYYDERAAAEREKEAG